MERIWKRRVNIAWGLFLLLIPTQLGRHFWPEWSLVGGVRSDYLSPTLYLTDVVWGMLIIFNFKFLIFNFKNGRKWLLLGILAAVNILMAGVWPVAVYRWIRIGQWLVTIWLVKNNREGLHCNAPVRKMLKWVVPVWIIGETMLGVAQLVNGGSLQGIMYWLGERRFTIETPGIAQMAVVGRNFVRAYGTFSHPNSFGGFLLVSWLWWREKEEIRKQKLEIRNRKPETGISQKIGSRVVDWMAILGMAISGSRMVWLILGGYLGWKLIKKFRERWGYVVVGAGIVMMVLGLVGANYRIGDFVGGWDKESFEKRWELTVAAGKMIKENPLSGVGAGNFVAKLPEINIDWGKVNWWQPVHNILLLGVSEIGIVGMMILIFSNRRKVWLKGWWVWAIILTGMADHYWLTLPQNMWLVSLFMGIAVQTPQSLGQLPLTGEPIKKKLLI